MPSILIVELTFPWPLTKYVVDNCTFRCNVIRCYYGTTMSLFKIARDSVCSKKHCAKCSHMIALPQGFVEHNYGASWLLLVQRRTTPGWKLGLHLDK
jgi:hypothetical protein